MYEPNGNPFVRRLVAAFPLPDNYVGEAPSDAINVTQDEYETLVTEGIWPAPDDLDEDANVKLDSRYGVMMLMQILRGVPKSHIEQNTMLDDVHKQHLLDLLFGEHR